MDSASAVDEGQYTTNYLRAFSHPTPAARRNSFSSCLAPPALSSSFLFLLLTHSDTSTTISQPFAHSMRVLRNRLPSRNMQPYNRKIIRAVSHSTLCRFCNVPAFIGPARALVF